MRHTTIPIQGLLAVSVAAVFLLTGCAATPTASSNESTTTQAAANSSETPAAWADLIAASTIGVPESTATVPDGVYRVNISRDDLIAASLTDLSNAGTWTFTVQEGRYTLECAPVSNPDTDCGNAQAATWPATVEVGPLRGDGTTMWIVHDVVATAEVFDCDPLLGEQLGGCGPLDPYQLSWSAVPDGLMFVDPLVGGQRTPASSWWLKPYTKIA